MFESDDFDQVLSQLNFPEEASFKPTEEKQEYIHPVPKIQPALVENINKPINPTSDIILTKSCQQIEENGLSIENISPKHTKRKIIHSYFDHKSKRKFPGPAGLLTGGFKENNDETVCHMELLSQDVDFSQTSLRGDLFESPLWARLQDDLKSWSLIEIDSIKSIKQQAICGNLRRRKAHTVTAVVETIDRSATDPLVIIRDPTGSIKGTLHRDAWTAFSQYIASEFCAFILHKPTILTTGSAYKKHYLNITLSNIRAMYSSTVIEDEAEKRPMPDNFTVIQEDGCTVIKTEISMHTLGNNYASSNDSPNDASDIFEELDSLFSDDIF